MILIGSNPEIEAPLRESAEMFRGSMSPEKFTEITNQQGAYDVCVSSKGNSKHIDRDQIGFRHGDLNFDVAFQPERGVYEFGAFRDGKMTTILGKIYSGRDRESVRELAKSILGEVYGRVREGDFSDMEIPVLVKEKLDAYRNRVPAIKHEFSNN